MNELDTLLHPEVGGVAATRPAGSPLGKEPVHHSNLVVVQAADRDGRELAAGASAPSVALGDHVGAARVGIEIIAAAPALGSARVHSGLAQLRQRLSEQAAWPEVIELNDRLEASAASAQTSEAQAEWPV
jgi:hypothetical protein